MKVMVRSWKDSVSLVFSGALVMMAQVALKAVGRVYVQLFRTFWWLLALGMLADSLDKRLLAGAIWFLLMIFFFLTVRASVRRKDLEYYVAFIRSHGFKVLVGYVLFMFFIISVPIVAHFQQLLFVDSIVIEAFSWFLFILWWPFHFLGLFPGYINPLNSNFSLVPFIMPVFVFLMLFLFEDKRGVSAVFVAFRRAYLMFFDLLPLCALVYLVFLALAGFLQEDIIYPVLRALDFIPSFSYSPWYIFMLLVPVPVCFIAALYTHQLHKQYDRYY